MKSEFGFGLVSREIFLLANNVLLVVSAASIFLGTMFPMIYQALTDDLISIGPPYFNAIFGPLMVLLILVLAVGPMSRWKRTSTSYLVQQLAKVAAASIAIGVVLPLLVLFEISFAAIICVVLASWIVLSMAKDLRNKIANKETVSKGLRTLSLSYYGMQIAHIGVAVMLIGVGLTSYFSAERSVLLAPGATVTLGSYAFRFDGSEATQGPNYIADQATFSISKDGNSLGELYPERRIYLATGTPSTEMAIDAGFLRDLFITLGEEKEDGAWTMTVYVKPFVRWIWLGAIFMATGGTLAATDKRYRRLRQRKSARDIAAKEKIESDSLQPASS
jgi:cytochrome c-type biogenesis protein CcmF